MNQELNSREALLELKRQMNEVAEQDEKIQDLREQIDAAIEIRAAAVAAAADLLEGYVEYQGRVHGFTEPLSDLVTQKDVRPKKGSSSTKKKTRKKRATKKKTRKKRATKKAKVVRKKTKAVRKKSSTVATQRSSETGRRMPSRSRRATGYPHDLASAITMNASDKVFIDELVKRWPLFTTPEFFIRKGISAARNHVTAKVSHLRKKGVPIESARDARKTDDTVSADDRGYRLIAQ